MNINELTSDWENWKHLLGQAVEFAEEIGISREHIVSLARQAGDVLAENVTPTRPEQKTMKELWSVADEKEKEMLAGLMTRLVSG